LGVYENDFSVDVFTSIIWEESSLGEFETEKMQKFIFLALTATGIIRTLLLLSLIHNPEKFIFHS